jgi:hypothetical protein
LVSSLRLAIDVRIAGTDGEVGPASGSCVKDVSTLFSVFSQIMTDNKAPSESSVKHH